MKSLSPAGDEVEEEEEDEEEAAERNEDKEDNTSAAEMTDAGACHNDAPSERQEAAESEGKLISSHFCTLK